MSTVYNGAELGYNVRASINVPLTDTIAIRASGFTRVDPAISIIPYFTSMESTKLVLPEVDCPRFGNRRTSSR